VSNPPLSQREYDVLTFLAAAEEWVTRGPSHREIMAACGLPSIGTTWRVIMSLCDKGYLKADPHHYRSLRVVREVPEAPFDLSSVPTIHLRREIERRKGFAFEGISA
jgi:SOS-response transcriptional repressor LexA